MSQILYYSKHCQVCNRIISELSKNDTSDIHFICIDERRTDPDGSIKVILNGHREIVMPDNITSVPALLLMTRGYRILTGYTEIVAHLRPTVQMNHKFEQSNARNEQSNARNEQSNARNAASNGTMQPSSGPPIQPQQSNDFSIEPIAFGMMDMSGMYGVASDMYSFLDQTSDSLLAKGDGGCRQMGHYASVEHEDLIETPPDTYAPDTIGEVSIDKLTQDRNADANIGTR